jgi:hypothetical protein
MSTQQSNVDLSTFVYDEHTKAEIAIVRLNSLSDIISDIRKRTIEAVKNYRNDPNPALLDQLVEEEIDALRDFNEVLDVALKACYNLMLSATEMHSAYLIMSNAIINLTKQTEKE